jgi:hypothetical protein
MALTDLVNRLRHLRKTDPQFAGLKLRQCAWLVLRTEFGVDPSDEEVIELAREVRRVVGEDSSFLEDWDFEEEANTKGRQTGGGREIVYKSEPRAG